MLAVTWHRVYPGARQRILAQRQYVEGLSIYLKISRHLAFFPRILMAHGALLDIYFGQCSYYRSQHARCCCYKYRVLSNLILCNLISSAIVDDLIIFNFFSFDLYTTWA